MLVTGGAGAIGSNLSRSLADLGARVIILDDLSASPRWNVPELDSVQFLHGDILDEKYLQHAFSLGPQLVFHLAALFANQNSIDHPERDLMVNGLGTLRTLESSVSAGVERFVYTSSSSIYDGEASLPLQEGSMSMNLSTPYQITKMLGELYCNYFHSHHDLDVVKARLFNSYGPGELPGQYRNVIPNFIYWAMNGIPLPVTGTGEETRDFTYIGDLVDGLLRLGFYRSAVAQEVNLASGRETRIGELAHRINSLAGSTASIKLVERRNWDTKSRRWGDIARAQNLIGYHPNTSLEEGLQETIAWFRDNWDRIGAAARFESEMPAASR